MFDKWIAYHQEAEPKIGPTDAPRDGAQEAEALQEHFARLTFDAVEQGEAGYSDALLDFLGRVGSTISYVLKDPARFEPLKAHPFFEISRKKPNDKNISRSMMYFITRATTPQMRNRAGKYARVIEFMVRQGIALSDMPEQIRLLGGIEATYERAKGGYGLDASDSDESGDITAIGEPSGEGGAEIENPRAQPLLNVASSVEIETGNTEESTKATSTPWPRSLSRAFLARNLIVGASQSDVAALRPGRMIVYNEVTPPDAKGIFGIKGVRVIYLDSSTGPWPELVLPSPPEKPDDRAETKVEPMAPASDKSSADQLERARFAESFRRRKQVPNSAVVAAQKSPFPPRKKGQSPSSKPHARSPSTKPSARNR